MHNQSNIFIPKRNKGNAHRIGTSALIICKQIVEYAGENRLLEANNRRKAVTCNSYLGAMTS